MPRLKKATATGRISSVTAGAATPCSCNMAICANRCFTVWESFGAFNRTGPTIEWRLEKRGERLVPLATIHRWFVSDPEDGDKEIEVLVVEKVGQPFERDGCAMAYVVATGNDGANEKARSYADRLVHGFECGADQPAIDAGNVPVPEFTRFE